MLGKVLDRKASGVASSVGSKPCGNAWDVLRVYKSRRWPSIVDDQAPEWQLWGGVSGAVNPGTYKSREGKTIDFEKPGGGWGRDKEETLRGRTRR
jgi:hypothetical protein